MFYPTSEGKQDALWGEECCWQFVQKLEKFAWISAENVEEQPLIIIFHNLMPVPTRQGVDVQDRVDYL